MAWKFKEWKVDVYTRCFERYWAMEIYMQSLDYVPKALLL